MLFSITAPSGGGKEFLKKALLARFPQLIELCWTTTRPLRHGEIQGVTRESVSPEEFAAIKGELELVQELPGGSYGIRRKFLELGSGNFLTEFHIENLMRFSAAGPRPIAIALIPRDIGFLSERLERRRSESLAEIAARLKAAPMEIEMIRQNLSLFSLIVEFTKEDEHTIVGKACEFVGQALERQPTSTTTST